MATPSKGVRFAVDVGTARIGLARCDQDQIMAIPVATLSADAAPIAKIVELVHEYNCAAVYIGKPISLSDRQTASTQMAIDFATELAGAISVPVHLLDERLSTVTATTQLQASGRTAKNSKSVVDQVAAVILLDHALAIEKSRGTLAGELVKSELD